MSSCNQTTLSLVTTYTPGDLLCTSWRQLMETSLATQVAAVDGEHRINWHMS